MADDIILGAKQYRNPKGVKPAWDTERPSTSRLPGGETLDISNYAGHAKTDMANPPKSEVESNRTHPLEDFAKPQARQHFGAGIKITEN